MHISEYVEQVKNKKSNELDSYSILHVTLVLNAKCFTIHDEVHLRMQTNGNKQLKRVHHSYKHKSSKVFLNS